MSRFILMIALLVLGLAAQDPPTSTDAAPQYPLNDTCPVMEGEPVTDNPVVVEYLGRKINLCCKKCKRIFFQEPEKYIKGLPQFAVPAATASNAPVVSVVNAALPSPEAAPLLIWLGRFHVAVVHFPIALILFAALLETWNLLRRNAPFEHGVKALLLGGVLSAVLAITLGLLHENSIDFTGERHAVLEQHELFAWIGAASAFMAWLLSLRARAGALLLVCRLALWVAAVCVGVAGHAGGRLTQGLGFFSRG